MSYKQSYLITVDGDFAKYSKTFHKRNNYHCISNMIIDIPILFMIYSCLYHCPCVYLGYVSKHGGLWIRFAIGTARTLRARSASDRRQPALSYRSQAYMATNSRVEVIIHVIVSTCIYKEYKYGSLFHDTCAYEPRHVLEIHWNPSLYHFNYL